MTSELQVVSTLTNLSLFTCHSPFDKIAMSRKGDYLYWLDSSMTSPILYFRETYDELKKVRWPTRPEIVKLTAIVLILSLIVGLYVGGLDYLFVKIAETILR